MPRPSIKIRGRAEEKKKKLPAKVGITKTVRDAEGHVIFVGTENEWRKWTRKRHASH